MLPVPVDQHAMDMSHGSVNVLFTVELPLVCDALQRAGWTQLAIAQLLGDLDVNIDLSTRDAVADAEDNQPDGLPRSITNALAFFSQRCYLRAVDAVRSVSREVVRVDE